MVPEIVDMDMPVEGVFHNLVITQIKKEYAGQGQKVMNAMWGAGQMMFNKILVLADEHVKIQNYEALAKYVFKNLNPATDVIFTNGPMDVLDHSCSKLGFGGKMCIDGTAKYEEETDDSLITYPETYDVLYAPTIMSLFTEIKIVNESLLKKGISCLMISVEKNRKGHVKELHEALLKKIAGLQSVKMILYVEHTVDANDLPVALWRFCNNLDPKRDSIIVQGDSGVEEGKTFACVGLDGTRKTRTLDNFQRDWPNIIVASDDIIDAVDKKWSLLGLGTFIASPSLKFKGQMYGEEAIVE